MRGNPKYKAKPILQYDLEGNFIQEYEGAYEASIVLGVSKNSILNYKNHKVGMACGFIWKVKESEDDKLKKVDSKYIKKRHSKEVCQYDLKGNLIQSFKTIKDAASEVKKSESLISMACGDVFKYNKTAGGFIWRYKTKKNCDKKIDI